MGRRCGHGGVLVGSNVWCFIVGHSCVYVCRISFLLGSLFDGAVLAGVVVGGWFSSFVRGQKVFVYVVC